MTDDTGRRAPTVDDVVRIAAIGNRVIRNLEITECYADLSQAVRDRVGAAPDWCTFATWASRQAGSTIRGEDLGDRLRRRLGEKARLLAPLQSLHRLLLRKGLFEPDTTLGRVVAAIHSPFDAFERASAAVAAGNLKVFEEIGREFARFIESVPSGAYQDSPELAAFAGGLRRGGPPDGQDYLRDAFFHYQQQRHETDARTRAALVLLGNLEIGLHEQTRLQEQITAAVDAPLTTVEDLGTRVLRVIFPGSPRWPHFVHYPAVMTVGWIASGVRKAATRITREVVTESMMVLTLPGGVLSLARNLDAPVPTVLAGTLHGALAQFLVEHDPCGPVIGNCGAWNWCDLGERMHYIVHLFRAYAEERSLFARPFTGAQVARFRRGVIPDGQI